MCCMTDVTLWYTTRAAGIVSLVMLSGVVTLGLLAHMRVEGHRWPRFLTQALHRNLALLAVAFLALHIVTAVVDPYTHLGLVAATVPFGSWYRTFWLGLGTIAFELIIAMTATSLLRTRLSVRLWRVIHWTAYLAWPLAVVHGLGTGADAFSLWSLMITIACVLVVGAAATSRWLTQPPNSIQSMRRRARQADMATTR